MLKSFGFSISNLYLRTSYRPKSYRPSEHARHESAHAKPGYISDDAKFKTTALVSFTSDDAR
ncbi:hypothetical protein Hanom_Chr11g00998351 [Helianthus anomalus]